MEVDRVTDGDPSRQQGDGPLDDPAAVHLVKAHQTVTLDHGSWDMHTDLGTTEWGDLQRMVAEELASALAAFYTDLGALGDKVTAVTLSEFGRTVRENGNTGADHGCGNAMLVLGAGVRGGQVHGS